MAALNFDVAKFKFTDARKDLVYMARIAENAERYEDMCKLMRHLITSFGSTSDLSVEERNLLSVAFKNVIGARRASWRTLNVEEHSGNELVKTYKKQLEAELDTICHDVIDLLQHSLIPHSRGSGTDAEVFYLKMTGDYYRYLAEFIIDKGYDHQAAKHYQDAMDVAASKLPPTHPIRLGLALNFSVCYYEILKDKKKACELAKKAFDEAIAKLDQLDEASYKDSTLIMQLLRDNLTLWTSDNNDTDPSLRVEDVDEDAPNQAK